MPAIVAMLC